MREIKFRAWDEDSNTMVPYERLLDIGTKMFGSYSLPSVFDCYNKALILLFGGNDIYMQYTGLKDKNGTEIYEGDIVKRNIYGAASVGVIVWSSEGFTGFMLKIVGSDLNRTSHYYAIGNVESDRCGDEVLGNIYENLELLEGRE